jgi:hypothetical protein
MEDPMENKNKSLRKPVLLATTLLLTAVSLSGCIIPQDRGGRGDWDGGHHHWKDDRNWDNGHDWQGDGNGWWRRRH